MWATGCIFVEMFTTEPLFPGKTEGLQIMEVMAILGTPEKEDQEYLYESLSESIREMMAKVDKFKPIDLIEVFPSEYQKRDIILAADLARKMLAWHPSKRITAKQALKHPFFKLF